MKTFNLYQNDLLPLGFRYPERIRNFAESGDYPCVVPWWFVDAVSDAGKLFFSIRRHDRRNLIPFAKVDDGRGDVACFDGDDHSGNPKVLMLVLDDSGRRYSYIDFDDWLSSALKDAQQ